MIVDPKKTRAAFVFVFVVGAPILALACSDDDAGPRQPFDEDGGVDGSTSDTGSTDAGVVDARGPFDPADEAVACDASPCVTQIVAGDDHFCARVSDGTIRCWGDDTKGQLGGIADAGADGQTSLSTVSGVTQLSAAGTTTCARLDDGGVICWGGNESGQLGLEIDPRFDEDAHPVPTRVELDGGVDRIDVGQRSVCTIAATGTTCWGNDESSQLARGEPTEPVLGPAAADLGITVKRTAAGIDTGLAVGTDGQVYTWGAVAGPLAALSGRISSVTPTSLPSPLANLAAVSSLAVSGPMPVEPPPNHIPGNPLPPPNQHACIVNGGDVLCWGKSERGALGSGLPDAILRLPTFAPLGTPAYAQQIAAGGENTCVRLTNGTVSCTGENARGQLGIGRAGAFSSTFVGVTTVSGRALQVAVAKETVCSLMQGGTVVCWGGNAHGELGFGTRDDDAHPSSARVPF
jgi:alpha-tubulin suppressor-like RCC1 family protein